MLFYGSVRIHLQNIGICSVNPYMHPTHIYCKSVLKIILEALTRLRFTKIITCTGKNFPLLESSKIKFLCASF
jgi:hypothetical protein